MTKQRLLHLPVAVLCASFLAPIAASAQTSPEECLHMQQEAERLRRLGLPSLADAKERQIAEACVCKPQENLMVSCAGRCDGAGLA